MARIGCHQNLGGLSFEQYCALIIDGVPHRTTQFYLGSEMAWSIPQLLPEERRVGFGQQLAEADFRFYIHAPHSVNFGKHQDARVTSLMKRLQDQLVDLPGSLVVHMGKSGDAAVTSEQKTERMLWYLNQRRLDVDLAIENSAGQGTEYGWNLQEIHRVLEQSDNTNGLYLCLDTQHSFASGLCDWRSPEAAQELLNTYEELFPGRLRVIHLNDSAKVFGSRVDRHAVLGQGHIWSQDRSTLAVIKQHAEQHDIDLITETSDPTADFLVLASV